MIKSEDRGLAAETQREILEENLAWQGTFGPVSGKEKRITIEQSGRTTTRRKR